MTDQNLQKIIDGPVYLLEGNDGMVYGNSQSLAREVQSLREEIKHLRDAIGKDTSPLTREFTVALSKANHEMDKRSRTERGE